MLIIVSGLPGSGKSYFAVKLAKRLGAEYISSDQVRKAMDAMGRYRFEDKLTVYEEMAKKTGEGLRRGKAIVVDATFYRHEMRDIFSTLCKLLYKPCFYLEIRADRELVEERLSRPRPDSEADVAVYHQLVSEYEVPREDRLVLQSTNSNIEAMLTEAVAYIGKNHERRAD
jgi:predicted kinase